MDAIDLVKNMESLALHQKITTPTRFSALNQPILIDHFHTNWSHIDKCGTSDLSLRHHELIFVINKRKR